VMSRDIVPTCLGTSFYVSGSLVRLVVPRGIEISSRIGSPSWLSTRIRRPSTRAQTDDLLLDLHRARRGARSGPPRPRFERASPSASNRRQNYRGVCASMLCDDRGEAESARATGSGCRALPHRHADRQHAQNRVAD